jgi:hypothetical protein
MAESHVMKEYWSVFDRVKDLPLDMLFSDPCLVANPVLGEPGARRSNWDYYFVHQGQRLYATSDITFFAYSPGLTLMTPFVMSHVVDLRARGHVQRSTAVWGAWMRCLDTIEELISGNDDDLLAWGPHPDRDVAVFNACHSFWRSSGPKFVEILRHLV